MRRLALAVLVAFAAPAFPAAAQNAFYHRVKLSDADKAELDAISTSLNAIATLKGGFLQIEPSGAVDEGHFVIEKPGKIRFEYNPPIPTLIVADGHWVAVANKRLKTVDRYALGETPLKLVLSNTIDLRHDPALVGVEHRPGAFVVNMRTSQNRADANISLLFSEPDHDLRQWTVIDDQGLTTTVALRDVMPAGVLSPGLFVLPDKNALSRPQEN